MYEYYNPNPQGKRTGDCVVRALCKALNKSWDEVYILLCVQGFIDKDWGNAYSVWGKFLRSQGFKRYVIPNSCPDCYTIADFAIDHPDGTYIVATGSHVVCIKNGIVFDSWLSLDEQPTYYYYKE
jgi:hypothetical protein